MLDFKIDSVLYVFLIIIFVHRDRKVRKVIEGQRSPCSSKVEQRPPKPKVEGSSPFMDVFYLNTYLKYIIYEAMLALSGWSGKLFGNHVKDK